MSNLLNATIKLLEETEIPALEIYKHTDLSPQWQDNVVKGKTKEPSVVKVERLYNFLSGKELVVTQ